MMTCLIGVIALSSPGPRGMAAHWLPAMNQIAVARPATCLCSTLDLSNADVMVLSGHGLTPKCHREIIEDVAPRRQHDPLNLKAARGGIDPHLWHKLHIADLRNPNGEIGVLTEENNFSVVTPNGVQSRLSDDEIPSLHHSAKSVVAKPPQKVKDPRQNLQWTRELGI